MQLTVSSMYCIQVLILTVLGDPDKPKMPRGCYACDKCVAVFKNHDALVRHQEDHSLSESVPSQGNETDQGLSITEYKDGSIMRCTVCDLAFTTYGKFHIHMKSSQISGL